METKHTGGVKRTFREYSQSGAPLRRSVEHGRRATDQQYVSAFIERDALQARIVELEAALRFARRILGTLPVDEEVVEKIDAILG